MSFFGRAKMWVWNNFKQSIPKKLLVIHYYHKKGGMKLNL